MIRAVFFDHATILSSALAPYPGADAFIRICAIRFPLLLCAGSSRRDADNSLRNYDLNHLFLDVICTAEVENPKPAPDLLLAALGRIGFLLRDRNPIEPSECLVVESSPDGIAAARGAGMRSLAIAHSASPDTLASADFVRDSFAAVDLDEILRRCAG